MEDEKSLAVERRVQENRDKGLKWFTGLTPQEILDKAERDWEKDKPGG